MSNVGVYDYNSPGSNLIAQAIWYVVEYKMISGLNMCFCNAYDLIILMLDTIQ